MQCKVIGCATSASGRSYFCDRHKRNKVRHGHPRQVSVSSYELSVYLRTPRASICKNADSPVWAKLDAHWEVTYKRYFSGQPYVKYQ